MDLLMPVYLMEPIEVADLLAQEFRLREDWGSYHHVRAMAHEMGFHLSDCPGGKRFANPLDMPEGARWSA
jgi:hypothetical protein